MIAENDIRPFRTIRDKDVASKIMWGTGRIGYIESISPSELLKVFGLPTFTEEDSGDGKVHVEWVVRFTDKETFQEHIFSVYSWKWTFNPFEEPETRRRFNVGGSFESKEIVHNFVDSVIDYVYN